MPKPEHQSTAGTGTRRPRRILTGLGGLADDTATIDAALALARAMHADIAGHFVEESSLRIGGFLREGIVVLKSDKGKESQQAGRRNPLPERGRERRRDGGDRLTDKIATVPDRAGNDSEQSTDFDDGQNPGKRD